MRKLVVLCAVLFMSGMYSFAQTPKIIAHRGAWKNTHVPQNSIASLQAAIQQKAWGSEFDVQLTKDEVLVVNHDDDFYGIDIATSTYQELLAKKHPNGESIPTLEAYIQAAMSQNVTKLVLEVKPSKLGTERTLQTVALIVPLVKKLKAADHLVYISFSYEACLKLRELDKNAHIQYLSFQLPAKVDPAKLKDPAFSQYAAGVKTPQELKMVGLSGFDYQMKLLKDQATYIEDAKKIGVASNVWTVNKEEDLQFFIDHHIDYITTDEPELLHKLLQ